MAIQLPPQAYTRETMIQAYEWLQTQPPSIRELASSPDALVSLYMQARRRGGTLPMTNTHPVSSQAFKQDLKNLAEGLRQFENNDDHGGGTFSQPTPTPPHVANPHQPNMQAATGATANPTVNVMVTPAYQGPGYHQPMSHHPVHNPPTPVNLENVDLYASLDSKSHEMVRRVQSRFNLSSEKEALRMLIALGFDKVREMLPKG